MFAKLTKLISNYFEIDQRQAKGYSALLMICVILLLLPLLVSSLYNPKVEKIDQSKFFSLAQKLTSDTIVTNQTAQSSPITKAIDAEVSPRPNTEPREVKVVELNTADTTLLKTLPGIGSVYASRIVKFREALGGYYAVEQIQEIYGMPAETYDKIYPLLRTDTSLLSKINLKEASFREMLRHPYLEYEAVVSLANYRDTALIPSKSGLLRHNVLDSALIEKIDLYISYR